MGSSNEVYIASVDGKIYWFSYDPNTTDTSAALTAPNSTLSSNFVTLTDVSHVAVHPEGTVSEGPFSVIAERENWLTLIA